MFQINGKLTNKISVEDRAVQYGDGVFETIAVKENLLEFWKEHYQRLSKGFKVLKNKCPPEVFLKKEISKFLKKIKKKKIYSKNNYFKRYRWKRVQSSKKNKIN